MTPDRPGDLEALAIFMEGWQPHAGGEIRRDAGGITFWVEPIDMDVGRRYKPVVKFKQDHGKNCCGNIISSALEAAKRDAWEYFRARVLDLSSRDKPGEVKLTDQPSPARIEQDALERYLQKHPGSDESAWTQFMCAELMRVISQPPDPPLPEVELKQYI